jgi:hypothetical protein
LVKFLESRIAHTRQPFEQHGRGALGVEGAGLDPAGHDAVHEASEVLSVQTFGSYTRKLWTGLKRRKAAYLPG